MIALHEVQPRLYRAIPAATCNPTHECYEGTCRLCASGYCVDGYCCDVACADPCDVCNGSGTAGTCTLASAGFEGNPACGSTVCDGNTSICPGDSCTIDSDCAQTHYCSSNGTCQPRKLNGTACDMASMCNQSPCRVCESSNCVDGTWGSGTSGAAGSPGGQAGTTNAPAAPAPPEEGGCGCSVPAPRRPVYPAVLAALAVVLSARRRSRQQQ